MNVKQFYKKNDIFKNTSFFLLLLINVEIINNSISYYLQQAIHFDQHILVIPRFFSNYH